MNRVMALIGKEWADAFRNRYVMMLVIVLPVIMIGLPVAILGLGANPDLISGMNTNIPPELLHQEPYIGLSEIEAMQAFIGQQFNLFFLILPLAIPMTIATYSIVGEKRERSLEPLLATPISTSELLAAKAIAAAMPGVLTVWLAGALYAGALFVIGLSAAVRTIILSPALTAMILVVAPLMTVLATTVGLMVSSRVNDPRAAEQLGMVVILPVLAVFFAQAAGVLTVDLRLTGLLALLLVIIDAILLQVAVRLFQRETILTRWK